MRRARLIEPQVFANAVRFLEDNRRRPPWLLWIESFAPHEYRDPPRAFADRYFRDPQASDYILPQIGQNREGNVSKNIHGLRDYNQRLNWLVRLPGKAHAGTRVEPFVLSHDVPATILDLLGIESPEPLQGRSAWPLVTGAAGDLHGDTIITGWVERACVRDREWAYIIDTVRPDAEPLLFHTALDPAESHNVAARPSHARRRPAAQARGLPRWSPPLHLQAPARPPQRHDPGPSPGDPAPPRHPHPVPLALPSGRRRPQPFLTA